MALNKTSSVDSNLDITQLVVPAFTDPDATEDVQMSITNEGMSHILARLTDLYRNPVEAAVREIISNAIDASVLLPNNARRPIEVSLPTALRATFVVRDHGVGMSTETVRKIYSQYGASTKRNDMKQVGAYGLGAKAPLAYCTEFFVVTTNSGITTTFSVSRKAEGNFVKIISAESTDLNTGTVVTMPVKAHDVNEFKQALNSYRKFSFDVPVSIDGAIAATPEYVILEENFILDSDDNTTGRIWLRKDALVEFFLGKFSPFGYDFNYNYVLSGWSYRSPNRNNYGFNNTPEMVVELKPGVVDFSSSRDEITNNLRSSSLDDRVKDYRMSKNLKEMTSLLAIYKSFDRSSAEMFFNRIIKEGELVNKELFFKRNSSTELILSLEDLQTNDGYSPLKLLTDSYRRNVITAFHLAQSSSKLSFYNPALSCDPDLFGLKTSILRTENVTAANEHIKKSISENKAVVSLADFIFNLNIQSQRGVSRHRSLKVVLVKNATEATTKKLLASRRIFSENDFEDTIFIFVKTGVKIDDQIKLVSSETEYEITVRSIEELIERARELRKQNRTEKSDSDDPMSLYILTAEGFDTEVEVIERANRYIGHKHMTPSELVEENALLVLTKNAAASALVGAANNGLKITNRPVYVISGRSGLRAKHYRELVDYKGVIASGDFFYKCKQAEEIVSRATYNGRLLRSQLKAAELEDIVRSVIVPLYVSKKFYNNLLSHVVENHKENKSITKILKLAAKIDRYGGNRFGPLSEDEVRNSLSSAEANALLSLKDTIMKVKNEETLENALLNKIMDFSGETKGAVALSLFGEFYSMIEA